MNPTCVTCHAEITDRYHAQTEHYRGQTRWHCPDLQACGERVVALHGGPSVSQQREWFALQAAIESERVLAALAAQMRSERITAVR